MLLTNVRLVPGREIVDITVNAEMISNVSAHKAHASTDKFVLNLEGCIAFPGLINSHDHLDFNCFRPLGNGNYKNYTAWGKDIHQRYKDEINAILKIPIALRTGWGMYKNMLAGVTTVINHGDILKIDEPLITVKQEFQNLHSVSFQKNWKWKLNNPFKKKKLCVIHIGEGVDEKAEDEIDELLKWNLLKRKLIGIHAVAMNTYQAKKFKAIVWCPESNIFLLDAMPDIKHLKQHTDILFGTDSTLTGGWDIWQQLRLARDTQQATDEELFDMITKTPARTWRMNSGELVAGKQADLVIARGGQGIYLWDDFYKTDPADILLVMSKGKIKMFDDSVSTQLKQTNFNFGKFTPVNMNGAVKYVEGNLPLLFRSIKAYYPQATFPVKESNLAPTASHA